MNREISKKEAIDFAKWIGGCSEYIHDYVWDCWYIGHDDMLSPDRKRYSTEEMYQKFLESNLYCKK